MTDWQNKWRDHLIWAEDWRNFPYEDSVGKTTIGVGRNLEDRGLSDTEVETLLKNDMVGVVMECASLSYWDALSEPRKLVIADMVFNMGMPRFRGFVRLNDALTRGEWIDAAGEMVDSKWYRQTGRRSRKLVDIMLTGQYDGGLGDIEP